MSPTQKQLKPVTMEQAVRRLERFWGVEVKQDKRLNPKGA